MKMDDRFLYEARRDPDPAFADHLRSRLRREEAGKVMSRLPLRPAFGLAVVAGAIVSIFLFPSVRASAQAMLDLFRVRNFAPVAFDPSRLEKLRDMGDDHPLMVFDKKEVLQDPGEPMTLETPEKASSVVGYPVRTLQFLPGGLKLESVKVEDRGAMRVSADGGKVHTLLETLNLSDIQIPRELDGQWITVRKPQVVYQSYANGKRRATLIQAQSPEIELPPGADLPRLAEIGLRVLGVDKTQARRLAQSVDWRTTLLVPVPMNAASFRGIEIQGNPGLLIETVKRTDDGDRQREGTMVLWSDGGKLYAVVSNYHSGDTVFMAESVR
jgi:hypothetical protein